MILTIDVGNSNIVLSLFNKHDIVHKWRFITDKEKKADEYTIVIQQLFKTDNVNVKDIKGIVLSSVVPEITDAIKNSLKFINKKILLIGDKSVKTNVKISKKISEEIIGGDILMNIVAGKKEFGENFIVIDMGTATTFDVALKNGEYAGSIIMPGAELAVRSLHEVTSMLPLIEIKKPKELMGKNTIELMKSGIYYGYIGAIKEIIYQIQNTFSDTKFKICLTGGLLPIYVQDLKFIDKTCPDLTSRGLNEVWYMNK